jgi:hypothetical protein
MTIGLYIPQGSPSSLWRLTKTLLVGRPGNSHGPGTNSSHIFFIFARHLSHALIVCTNAGGSSARAKPVPRRLANSDNVGASATSSRTQSPPCTVEPRRTIFAPQALDIGGIFDWSSIVGDLPGLHRSLDAGCPVNLLPDNTNPFRPVGTQPPQPPHPPQPLVRGFNPLAVAASLSIGTVALTASTQRSLAFVAGSGAAAGPGSAIPFLWAAACASAAAAEAGLGAGISVPSAEEWDGVGKDGGGWPLW